MGEPLFVSNRGVSALFDVSEITRCDEVRIAY